MALITPIRLDANGQLPKGGVTLSFKVNPQKVPLGATPFVATYDPATRTWHPVASTYDAKTGIVSAHADHFSIWGVFSFLGSSLKALVKDIVASLFGSIKVTVPAPSCGDSTGLSATVFPSDGVLDVCAQNNGGTSVTLKVRSHLAFPVDVLPPRGTAISVSPPGGIFEQIGGYLNKVGTSQSTRTLVAAGSEGDLTFPLAANHFVTVHSDLDTVAYLASIIDSGVSLLTLIYSRLGGKPKAVLDAIGQGACAAQVVQAVDSSATVNLATISALTQVAVTCASSIVHLGVSDLIQGIIATASGLIENVLQSGFVVAMIIVGGVSGATSVITVTRLKAMGAGTTPGENCGVLLGARMFASGGAGFGSCRPMEISNGGDPSGVVSSIAWNSWGSGSTIGYGLSSIPRLPAGGYYPNSVRVELRAYGIGHCSGSSEAAYLHLEVREPSKPGGPLGPWSAWSGSSDICKHP